MVTTPPIPRQLGWRPLPAWSRPERFWLGWPAAAGAGQQAEAAREAAREDCLGLAELLSDYAPVSLICSYCDAAEVSLRTPPNVAAMGAEWNASAIGAYAPLWLVDNSGALVAAVTNSRFGADLAERAGVVAVAPPPELPRYMEVDGEGTVLAPISSDRREAALDALIHWLGVECPVLLEEGGERPWPGVRFLAPGLVALPPHPANYQRLDMVVDARGRRLTLVELPHSKQGDGCYADCLVAGDAVVVPDFEDGRGTEVFTRVAAALPGRRVSAFPAGWLAPGQSGLGAVVAVQPATSR